jgi:hypothetical protein
MARLLVVVLQTFVAGPGMLSSVEQVKTPVTAS